ncbi:hypothetical protein Nmel_014522, partial [Mimus melanotis]
LCSPACAQHVPGAATSTPALDHENSPFPWPSWCVKTLGQCAEQEWGSNIPPSPSSSSRSHRSCLGQDGEKQKDPQRWEEISGAALKGGGRKGTRGAGDVWCCTWGLCVHTPIF